MPILLVSMESVLRVRHYWTEPTVHECYQFHALLDSVTQELTVVYAVLQQLLTFIKMP